MLIDESCFAQISWTGKSPDGRKKKLEFKIQKNIQKILLQVLQVADKDYSQKNLHEDIVYKILKPKTTLKNFT